MQPPAQRPAPARSVILVEADRWLFHIILLVAVYVTFRGHNAPGGGFAGGLIASLAFVLRGLAGRSPLPRHVRSTFPVSLIGCGLMLAVGTAIAPLLVGGSLLESHIFLWDIPLVGKVKFVSSAVFDLGVFFVVLGVVLAVLTALDDDDRDESDNDTHGATS
jgi:multicomponent Na+:H+ antiporter subunit A